MLTEKIYPKRKTNYYKTLFLSMVNRLIFVQYSVKHSRWTCQVQLWDTEPNEYGVLTILYCIHFNFSQLYYWFFTEIIAWARQNKPFMNRKSHTQTPCHTSCTIPHEVLGERLAKMKYNNIYSLEESTFKVNCYKFKLVHNFELLQSQIFFQVHKLILKLRFFISSLT